MSARVVVPKRLVPHVLAGHPWLYGDGLSLPAGLASGELVALVDRDGRKLGHALHDARSPIALRVLTTRAGERPGPALWLSRIRDALTLRRETLDLRDTDAFRLLHGEGDRLPGVCVDHYAGHLVLKLDTEAWLPHLEDLADALLEVTGRRDLYYKGVTGRRGESREPGPLRGAAPPDPLLVREYGVTLPVSIQRGQKTGTFLDQRESRARVGALARDREVLNLFSYTGGFSIAAALGGARRVTSVDVAAPAIELARAAFVANDVDPQAHAFLVADAFDHLEVAAAERRLHDLVICDPPSFAHRADAVPKAISAYTRLHAAALKVTRPGGLLVACSCSSHVGEAALLDTLREAARKLRRGLRVLELRGQPVDHPWSLAFPEGRYLQFILCVVD
ncbi:MAG: class I SAM-dependent rRNA methyltransferase [Myxococcales bacterium]|nr:class I SAM-dependent rRNA methyltransferase [Myxococcales bacterium]